jgi:hypothetical protein
VGRKISCTSTWWKPPLTLPQQQIPATTEFLLPKKEGEHRFWLDLPLACVAGQTEPGQIGGGQEQSARGWRLQVEVSGKLVEGATDGKVVRVPGG